MCNATKGLEDVTTAFTNVSDAAPYWSTLYTTVPWRWTPAYALLRGFSLKTLFPDLLHCWNLGTARDLAGSAIRIFMDCGVFGVGNEQSMLGTATDRLKAFVHARKLPLKLKKLTKAKLTLSRSKYPELRSSGYDSYVVLLWLQHDAESHAAALPDALKTCIWAGNRAISVMCNAGHFLTELEESNKVTVGKVFLRTYMLLANEGLEAHRLIFRVRPKFHLLAHAFCAKTKSRVNCGRYSTWMDEDALKKLMKTLKQTDARTSERRLLQRWLLGLKSTFRKVREKKLCAWRPVL